MKVPSFVRERNTKRLMCEVSSASPAESSRSPRSVAFDVSFSSPTGRTQQNGLIDESTEE